MPTKKTTVEKRSCNQCGAQMILAVLDRLSMTQSDVCVKPKCPNYGLIQVPTERLDDYLKGLKTKKGKK